MSKTLRLFKGGMTEKVGCSTLSIACMRSTLAGSMMTIVCGTVLLLGLPGFGGGGGTFPNPIAGGGGTVTRETSGLLSCHRIHSRSNGHSRESSSAKDDSAIQMSRNTPVGMSQTKVSRFRILAIAIATKVPSIFPPSLVMRY